MRISEYAIYSVMGRSGSTFLRNQLSKYEQCVCLATSHQVRLLAANIDNDYLEIELLEQYLKYDIKSLYSKYEIDKEQVDTFIYKMPIFAMLESMPKDLFRRVKPILMMRNPIHTVLSASKKSFLPDPKMLDLLFESIQRAYTKLGIICPKEYINDKLIYKNDTIMLNAVIFKMSLYLHKSYLDVTYKGEYLLFSFEDFVNKPIHSMRVILKYMDIDVENHEIDVKLNEKYYNDVIEEGGILMSKNLDKNRSVSGYQPNKKLEEYLKSELKNLSYSTDNTLYPITEIVGNKS